MRQVGDGGGADGPAAADGDGHGLDPVPRARAGRPAGQAAAGAARFRDRHDLPGPDERAEPGAHGRRPARGGLPGPPRRVPPGCPLPGGGGAAAGGHPAAGAAGRPVPARVLRRHAPARRHRDGRHQRPAPARRGRAHDRARRHRAGPDPGDPPGGPGTDRRGDHDDHPRPGGGRGPRRPGAGDVRRNGGGVRPGGRGVRRAADAVHPRPARLGAASRAGRPAADARPRRAAVAAAPAPRVHVRPAVPAGRRGLPGGRAGAARHGPPGPSRALPPLAGRRRDRAAAGAVRPARDRASGHRGRAGGARGEDDR